MTEQERSTVQAALTILENNIFNRSYISSPQEAKDFIRLSLEPMDREGFLVLFLDNQHGVIKSEVLFKGTINSSEVHPRVIAREALLCNAQALIIAHNHPSGKTEPSPSDRHITSKIQSAIELFDMRLLDHLIVGNGELFSFAEKGLL